MVNNWAARSAIKRLEPPMIHIAMSEGQKADYARAIHDVVCGEGAHVVTSDFLFKAADIALAGETSSTEARIGLQPGTMNPIHYGHLSASLAGAVSDGLEMVLLVIGGSVPDKLHTADFNIRYEMARIATDEPGLAERLRVTPIRQQLVDIFSSGKRNLLLAGENESIRRSNMDIAAFIWLFRANPKVKWTFIVGSDKVIGYGPKGEYGLVVETLGDVRANVQILYNVRAGHDIDVERDIAPYDWMLEKWQSGFFKRSSLPANDIPASKIRMALVKGQEDVDGMPLGQCLPKRVLAYIRNSKGLLAMYAREIQETQERRSAREESK